MTTSRFTSARYYHRGDYPGTLEVLTALAKGRDLSTIGFELDDTGAEIDWVALHTSWLSTTEKAVVHIAEGVALAERAGGLPPHLSGPVLAVVIGIVDVTLLDRLLGEDPGVA